MLMMNIIFVVFCFPILPIMYFVLRNATKPKKNMILYVTLPYSARQDDSVLAICRSFRRHLGIMAIILTALIAGPFFIGYFSIALTYHMTWLCAAIIAPFFSYAKYHRKLKRLKQEKNWESDAAGKGIYADSDENWIIGMFYFNPNDNHTMINARFGIGMTVNLAKTAGKIIMVFALLCILAMPFFGAALIPGEFTPVRIELSDRSIMAYHTSLVFDVHIDDVNEIELIDALPGARRVAGTAFDTLLKGRFRIDGIGLSRLCLNPEVSPFILINTAETTYIFGTNNAVSTHELYLAIRLTMNQAVV